MMNDEIVPCANRAAAQGRERAVAGGGHGARDALGWRAACVVAGRLARRRARGDEQSAPLGRAHEEKLRLLGNQGHN